MIIDTSTLEELNEKLDDKELNKFYEKLISMRWEIFQRISNTDIPSTLFILPKFIEIKYKAGFRSMKKFKIDICELLFGFKTINTKPAELIKVTHTDNNYINCRKCTIYLENLLDERLENRIRHEYISEISSR